MTKVFVQPDTKHAVSGPDDKAITVALDKVHVISSPRKMREVRVEGKEEGLACSVEEVTYLEGTGSQGSKDRALSVLNDR